MRLLSPLLLVTALSAAEPAAAPLMNGSMPDFQRTIARFNDSIYGALWNDPQMAPLREKMLESMDAKADELGFKISDVIVGSRSLGIRLRGFAAGDTDPTPQLDFSYDAGALAAKLFTAWQESGSNLATEVPGADAAFSHKDGSILARFGEMLVGTMGGGAPAPWKAGSSDADFTIDCDARKLLDELIAATPERRRDDIRAATAAMEPYLGATTYRGSITKEGMLERMTTSNSCLWLTPVDRAALDRLPATGMNVLAVGLDGKQLWAALKQPMLAAMAKEMRMSEDDALAFLDGQLAQQGFTVTTTELMEGMTGTFALAVAPGSPFPSLTIQIPRGAALDSAVSTILDLAGAAVPDEGGSSMIPIPNLPVPVTIARDAGGWMVTSDAMLPGDWLAKKGGFLASPAAKLAIERGGEGAVMIGCSDTPTVLRTLIPYLAMGLGQAQDLEADQRQAILQLLQKAAGKAGTGYVVAKPEEGGMAFEMRGLVTYSLVPAIAAAIAIPNLIESRVSANEMAAATSLRSGVFPALIQFQSGGYVDLDGDGIGSYGFFSEMAGTPVGEQQIALSLLTNTWNAHRPVVNNYRFALWLPDDRGGAIDTPDARASIKTDAEDRFVAYAWPEDQGDGRTMFALLNDGRVYAAAWNGQDPSWNAIFGGDAGTWESKPTWKTLERFRAAQRPARKLTPAAMEAAAATSLKSGVHPAQVQFQAGGYRDSNGNNIGDFGFPQEMSGAPVGDAGFELSLLPEEWNDPRPVVNGYRFITFVSTKTGAAGSVEELVAAGADGSGEMNFICYGVPADPASGAKKIFALFATGVVYAADWDGTEPQWNTVFGGGDKGFADQPVWQPYRR